MLSAVEYILFEDMTNIREKQINLIAKMLSLDSQGHSIADGGVDNDFIDQWKVLIYDQDCRDIISPLMNVGSLRQKGVTLHMMLHADREAIPDAPAVYFIRPTEANMKRVAEDSAKQLYRSCFLNFVSRIERPILEKFAQSLVSTNSVGMVSKIFDQYLDVVSLEPSLFTLNINDSYLAYNSPSAGEMEIRHYVNKICMGLLSFIRIYGALPIIRAPQSGAAMMLAQELCDMVKENLSPRGPAQSLFADCLVSDRARPLMLIFDRTADMSSPLMHTSSYQALIDDLLDHKLNRVTIDLSGKDGSQGKKKTYDLNTQTDPFYARFACCPFPVAVEANEKELAEVSQKETEIRSRPQSFLTSSSESAAMDGKDLSEAIESLPDILNKKANLEAHTNILQAVMNQIAGREVPTYFEMEQALINAGRILDKTTLINLLRDSSKGNTNDKARLLVLVALISDSSIMEYETAFSQGCESMKESGEKIADVIAVCKDIRKNQSLQSPMSLAQLNSTAGSNVTLSSLLTTAQSAMAKAASFFTKFAPVYVTRVVDALAEGKSCPEDDSFCSLDPKLKPGELVPENRNTKYSDVIVFVVGGGCYSEYFNLQESLKQKVSTSSIRSITYGCTEILSGDSFLSQLERISKNK